MIEDQEVVFNGRRYTWSYDGNALSPNESWRWRDREGVAAPIDLIEHLNGRFFERRAADVVRMADYSEIPQLRQVFLSMGATSEQLEGLGISDSGRTRRVDEALAPVIPMPPAALSPFNCEILRDWFFVTPRYPFTNPLCVLSVGNGPFMPETLDPIFRQHNVVRITPETLDPIFRQHQVPLSAETFAISLPNVILGREGWAEVQIDRLIEKHSGQTLKIYSQEMFLAYLATGTDPFDGSIEVLDSFKAGHPGLEFVAEGWQGWVTTCVNEYRRATPAESVDSYAWAQESPLHALGYKVGMSGEPTAERRRILERAFKGQLPAVKSAEYMAEWGTPQSPERLKKMATFIASMCRNAGKQPGNYEQAISDYEADLSWLRQTFYQGHMRFSWPSTIG